MIQKLSFNVLVNSLGVNAYMLGTDTPEAKKGFLSINRSIDAQLKALTDKVLNRKLNGRKRLELLTSLEEDAFDPGTSSENTIYLSFKKIATELGDIALRVINGETKLTAAFSKKAKQFRLKKGELLENLNISKTGESKNFHKTNNSAHV